MATGKKGGFSDPAFVKTAKATRSAADKVPVRRRAYDTEDAVKTNRGDFSSYGMQQHPGKRVKARKK